MTEEYTCPAELDEEYEGDSIQDNESIEDKIYEENIEEHLKLDYKLESPVERTELVRKIIEQTPPAQLTNRYLEILSDYIICPVCKENIILRNILL